MPILYPWPVLKTNGKVNDNQQILDLNGAGGIVITNDDGITVIDGSGISGGGIGVAGITIDGGGVTPTTGSMGFLQVPYNATITGWTILANQSGSTQLTVKKSTYPAFPATVSIVAAAPPVLISQQNNETNTLPGWTTTITAGDVLEFVLDSIASVTRLTLELQLLKS